MFQTELAWATQPSLLGSLVLARRLDVLAASTGAAEPVGALLVRGARLLVRTSILLIVGMTDSFLGMGLFQVRAPLLLIPKRATPPAVVAARDAGVSIRPTLATSSEGVRTF